MDLERVILNEVSQTEKEKYCLTSLCMWNLKRNDTNELSYKTDLENDLMVSWGRMGEGIVKEFGINKYTLLYLKWRTKKDLPDSTWNSAQCLCGSLDGRGIGGEWIYACVWLNTLGSHWKD